MALLLSMPIQKASGWCDESRGLAESWMRDGPVMRSGPGATWMGARVSYSRLAMKRLLFEAHEDRLIAQCAGSR